MRYKTFLLLIGVILLAGCNPCRRLAKRCPTSDSISYIETVKLDTLILTSPADTFTLRIPYDPVSLSDLGFFAKSSAASVELKVIEGVLQVQAICPEDSLKAIIANLQSRSVKTIRVPYPEIEYKARKIHKAALWFSGIIILIFLLWVANKIKKFLPF